MNVVRQLLGAIVWLVLVVAIALGAAGLATGMDHQAGTSGRADLTAAGDAEVEPLLDAAEADLTALASRVEALGIQARGALAALNGVDVETAEAAIADGAVLVDDIVLRTAVIRGRLATVPYVGTQTASLTLSDEIVARHAALVAALDATAGLDAAWQRLTLGAVTAARMSRLLAEHDRLVGMAAARGRQARYEDAQTFLGRADEQIAAARALRDQLSATVDVTVLDEWLDRNEAYDVALRDLYKAIATVGGKVTDRVRDAIAAETKAKARLPPDTRGLVIIMAEIGRGGMNGAVISIEETRGKLTTALDAIAASSTAPSATPSR